jgi:tetratricopeptide (TPR) repeat protein
MRAHGVEPNVTKGRGRQQKRRTAQPVAPHVAARVPRFRSRIWIAIVIAGATSIAYAPALRAPFGFDDEPSIQKNVTIRSLWPASIPLRPPKGDLAVSGRPIVNYSLAVNYAMNRRLHVDQRPDPDGPNKTLGYHLINLLLHLGCGALLFGLVVRTLERGPFGDEWKRSAARVATAVTALWLLHPIQSEAVNYVVQRTELMVSLCYLATLYAWRRAWDARTRYAAVGWRTTSLVACVVGMGSKEVMITAPLAVILYDRAFVLTSWRGLWNGSAVQRWFYVLLAATTLCSAALIATGARSATVGFHAGIAWYEYLYSQAWAVLHYVRLFFWPDHLTIDYGQKAIEGWRGIPGLFVLGAFGGATILAWVHAQRWGWFGLLGAWFFMLLAPSSSFVPIGTEIAAERRIYLALASVIVLVVLGGEWLWRFGRAKWRGSQAIVVVERSWPWVAGGLIVALGALTFNRSGAFATPERLWDVVVARSPDNPRGYTGMAYVLLHENPPRVAEATPFLRRAIAIDSTNLPALRSLAAIAVSQGQFAEAEGLLRRELAIDPNYADARPRLAMVLVANGEASRAAPYLNTLDLESLAADDPTGESLNALGNTYMSVGEWGPAAAAFRRGLANNGSLTGIRESLGDALIRQGLSAEAIPALEDAVRLTPNAVSAMALLSLAYAKVGRSEAALNAAATAAAHAGRDASIYELAGRAALIVKRPSDAEAYFAEAMRLSPTDPEIITALGVTKAALGKRSDAAQLFRRALTLQPDFLPAQHGESDLKKPRPR